MAKHRAPRTNRLPLAGYAAAITVPAALAVTAWTHATPVELGAGVGPVAQVAPAVDRTVLEEDDPAWRCWVDGNRLCSTVPLDGAGLS